MATSELASPRPPVPARSAAGARYRTLIWPGLPVAIGVLLLIAITYSAFAHGAVSRATATRVELVIAALSALAALGWIWLGTVMLRTPRETLIGGALLGTYACWSALSVLWSISPDQTWIEANRVFTYTLVLGLGVAVGSSHPRAVELIGTGFLLVALAVTVYALAQKLLPGVQVPGVFNLNQTGALPRLQEPLGYWNALALFIVMGAPGALALSVDGTRSTRLRLAAACALALILTAVPLTYSRGGLIALVVALGVSLWTGRERLRSLVWLAVALLAGLPAILVGLLLPELSSAHLSLATREWAGGVLALAVVLGLGALVLAGRRLIELEPRLRIRPDRAASMWRIAGAGAVSLVVAGLAALALSSHGFTGEIAHIWHGFTSPRGVSDSNPQRLLSADSYRWLWWKEAASAFSARPWQGWGAGSFPVLHLLYRHNVLPVQQPHSVPLQFLAETGVTGALLGIGAFVLLVTGAIRGVRSRPVGRERLLAAALLGPAVAYGVHSLYDWDWNIPALSLPALLFLGVVAARRSGPLARAAPSSPAGTPRGTVFRALALGAAAGWLCVFALSAELPQLAADKASAALVSASSGSRASVRSAQAEAVLASQLDPLSDAGLVAQATAAVHEARLPSARILLQRAVARDPSDPQAWSLLARIDWALGDTRASLVAVQRTVDLDPLGSYAQAVVRNELHRSPPGASATRVPSPAVGR